MAKANQKNDLTRSADRVIDDENYFVTPIVAPKMGDMPDEETARRLADNGIPPHEIVTLLGISPMKLARMLKREDDPAFLRELTYEYEKRRGTICLKTVLNVQPLTTSRR